MTTAQYDIYLSCVKDDQEFALKLYNNLKSAGLKPWLNSENGLSGKNKKSQMHEAIQNSRYFMPLISAASVSQRGKTQRELKIASDILDEFAISDIFIIPIRLDDTQLPDYRLQAIEPADFTQSYAEGFKQLRRVLIPDSLESKPTDPLDGEKKQPDPRVVKKVREKIGQILKQDRLELFKKELIAKLKRDRPDNYQNDMTPEEALVAIDILDAIHLLERAVYKCFQSMKKENAQQHAIREVWKEAVEILGLLVLLALDYDRLDLKNSRTKLKFEIPVLTEAGEEIVFASYTDSTPRLTTDPSRERVYGKNRICRSWPESGWEAQDILQTIKKDIWKQIFTFSDEHPPDFIDNNKTRMLNRRIKRKNDKKENIYISVPGNDHNNPLRNKNMLTMLKDELPALYIVIVTISEDAASDTVFILAEPDLEGELFEFFDNKPE